jgi:hypothetical protein
VRLLSVVRRLTQWAWEPEYSEGLKAAEELAGAKRFAMARGYQLALLEELFREKQAKITRLQEAYAARIAPKYEDMRKENPIKDAESLAQSISVLATRAESFRARTGKPMKTSDGTVLGVPGDQPNAPVGDGWR